MKDQTPPHRLFHHFSELPYSLRVLYTSTLLILGLGYLFALLNIYYTYAGLAPGSNPYMLTYQDLVAGYAGSGTGSILGGALNGPMATMAPPDEKAILLNWVKEGATRAAYELTIKPIIDKRCGSCHDGSNPNIPNLIGFDNLHKVTELNTGASIATLVRDSHIHFFGLSFIFFIVGLIFSHAYVRPVWFKSAVIGLPFLGILVDVSSWYMIKVFHPFALAEIAAGALMAACFAVMWLATMYQMWFHKPPEAILARMGGDIPDYWTVD